MKKQLLLGVALFSAISAFPQNGRARLQPNGGIAKSDKVAQKFAIEPTTTSSAKPGVSSPEVTNPQPQQELSSSPASIINWKLLCGSSNVYGQLVSNSRPLQYNPDLGAVSYIHRKSATYTATPVSPSTATSGVIVAEITGNWGTSFDSTCIWNDPTNWGRYPQGAIWTPAFPSNTITNAYIVGSGPTVAGSAFTGDWYASKKLAAPGSTLYNAVASSTPNATQFLSFTAPSYPANQGQHSWSRYGFSSTSDGIVRSLALIQGDGSTLAGSTGNAKQRGVSVVKGTYTGGIFNWTTDSIIPACVLQTTLSSFPLEKVLSSDVQMAWSQDGKTGYVLMLGELSSNTVAANRGMQPIVYKTTNSGGSWQILPQINFGSNNYTVVTDFLNAVSANTTLVIPNFQNYDMTVDSRGYLHIASLMVGAPIDHQDSLNYVAQYTMSINAGDKYLWGHRPGIRPYVYDFIGDGSAAWRCMLIDSLATEDPGAGTTSSGYAVNPWDNTGPSSAKIGIDPRVQLGRTPDGNYITFSWTESDTNFVNAGHKWNLLPDIHSRCLAVSGTTSYVLSGTEINVSKPAVGSGTINPKVSAKAFLHYMSPTTGGQVIAFPNGTTTVVDIKTPFTVTNSSPLQQLTNNITWFAGTTLTYTFLTTITGTGGNAMNSANASVLFPNPANGNATLGVELKENSSVLVNLYDLVGRVVKTVKAEGQIGENNINIDLTNLNAGIYMVNVKVGNATSTKKLIIQ